MTDAFTKFHNPTNKIKEDQSPQPKPEPPTYKVFCPEGRVWEAHGWPKIVIDDTDKFPILVFYDTPGGYEYGEMTAGFARWEAFEEVPVVMSERDEASR